MDSIKKDALNMDYKEWCKIYAAELWITYHEAADYSINHEKWCEKYYDSLQTEHDVLRKEMSWQI